MRLDALDDEHGKWGRQVVRAAVAHGWSGDVFERAVDVPSDCDYAFMRIAQHPPRTEFDKAQAEVLETRGVTLIPDITQIRLYDDKLAQSTWAPLVKFMPRTVVVTVLADVRAAGRALGFPLLSKTAQGSASHNVRMITSEQQLEREGLLVFTGGLAARYSVQRDYMILQEFLPDNLYDYRVVAVGRRRMILRRLNASASRPFASGSGKCIPIEQLDDETAAVMSTSDAFFAEAKTGWCGIDLVRDRQGAWKVLEVTLAWSPAAYARCVFFGTAHRGADIWKVLIEEIEQGAIV